VIELVDLIWLMPAILVWSVAAVLGGIVGYFSLQSWRRQRGRAMASLSAGFLLVSVGSAVTWFSMYFAGAGLFWCDTGSTSVMAGGLGCVAYSLATRSA
jgi:hypothetical protein